MGKESLVNLLYMNHPGNAKPLVCIDCPVLSEREWHGLTTQIHSPFFDTNRIIFFQHCEAIKKPLSNLFTAFLEETAFAGSNKLIFSFSREPGLDMPELQKWLNKKNALTIFLPPLRERIGDAYNMISLSINSLNQVLGKHIIGMEPAALLTIQQYHWPGNYSQFYNLLTRMMLLSNADIITDRVVRAVLADYLQQEASQSKPLSSMAFNINWKLQDHIEHIVRQVLELEGHNQTRAAKRLGISRSTLWRLMKGSN